MCKAVDRAMRIEQVRLVRKSGGKSGEWTAPSTAARAKPPSRSR
jgi:cyclic pyranopterin phosphate synthase